MSITSVIVSTLMAQLDPKSEKALAEAGMDKEYARLVSDPANKSSTIIADPNNGFIINLTTNETYVVAPGEGGTKVAAKVVTNGSGIPIRGDQTGFAAKALNLYQYTPLGWIVQGTRFGWGDKETYFTKPGNLIADSDPVHITYKKNGASGYVVEEYSSGFFNNGKMTAADYKSVREETLRKYYSTLSEVKAQTNQVFSGYITEFANVDEAQKSQLTSIVHKGTPEEQSKRRDVIDGFCRMTGLIKNEDIGKYSYEQKTYAIKRIFEDKKFDIYSYPELAQLTPTYIDRLTKEVGVDKQLVTEQSENRSTAAVTKVNENPTLKGFGQRIYEYAKEHPYITAAVGVGIICTGGALGAAIGKLTGMAALPMGFGSSLAGLAGGLAGAGTASTVGFTLLKAAWGDLSGIKSLAETIDGQAVSDQPIMSVKPKQVSPKTPEVQKTETSIQLTQDQPKIDPSVKEQAAKARGNLGPVIDKDGTPDSGVAKQEKQISVERNGTEVAANAR